MAKKDEKGSSTNTSTDWDPQYTPVESSVGETHVMNAPKAVEDGPETSPYSSTLCTLIIGPDRVEYTIHLELLTKCPKWEELRRTRVFKGFGRKATSYDTIDLPDVDESSGHTIVHYLYTGAFQTLKLPSSGSDEAGKVAKYTRTMRLYCTTKECGLIDLEGLLKQYAEIYSRGITFFEMLTVADEVFRKLPNDDVWFTDCLKKKMRMAHEVDKAVFTKDSFLDHIGNVKKLDRALMKCTAEIYAERDTYPEELSSSPLEERCLSPSIKERCLSLPLEERSLTPKDFGDAKRPANTVEPALVDELTDVRVSAEVDEPIAAKESPTRLNYSKAPPFSWSTWDTENLKYTEIPSWRPPTPPAPETSKARIGVELHEGTTVAPNREKEKMTATEAVLEDEGDETCNGLKKNKKKKGKKGREVMPEEPVAEADHSFRYIWGVKPDPREDKNMILEEQIVEDPFPCERPPVACERPPVPCEEPAVPCEDSWGFKKKKKGKKPIQEELDVVAPIPPPVEDIWSSWGTPKKRNERYQEKIEVELAPAVEYVAFTDDSWASSPKREENDKPVERKIDVQDADTFDEFATSSLKKKKKGKKPKTLDWDIEYPVEICATRAVHLQDDELWKVCVPCRAFIKGLVEKESMMDF